MVLITMACVSLAISLTLHRKSRALARFPKNMQAGIFRKTFNVFNPYSEQRKVIHEHLEVLILIAVYGSFVGLGFVFLKIFEFGFLLGFLALIVCLGFLLVDETLEVHKNASVTLNALKKGVKFGKGDLEMLDFLRKTLPRLSYYHLSIALAFFAASLTVPYVVNGFLWSFVRVAGVIFVASAVFWFFPPFVLISVGILFAATVLVVQFVANRVKMRIFSFPPPEQLNVLSEQFYRMKMFVGIQHHHPTLHVPDTPEHKKEDETGVESSES